MNFISLNGKTASIFKSVTISFPSPYGMKKEELVESSEKAASLLVGLMNNDFELNNFLQFHKQNFRFFRIDGAPLDDVIGNTPVSPDTSIPPDKTTFVMEWFTLGVQSFLGFTPWNQGDFHNGVYLQNVCRRNGHEGNATSRGGAELTWHCDNPVNPPLYISLGCERPSKEGGVTHFVDTAALVKALPPNIFQELCKPNFEFDTIVGGNYKNESARYIVPIVEMNEDGEINIVRLQSRKNSIIGLTQEATDALIVFRKAVSTAERFTTVWKRGMILFAANSVTAHMRTQFHQPDNDPEGRWLTKIFGE
jgi:alpha-ketoglutarate-dependent taurine dioxygenase